MPIKDKSNYPKDWPYIRDRILFRSSMWTGEDGSDADKQHGEPRCECEGECGLIHNGIQGDESFNRDRCGSVSGGTNPLTGSEVVLTVAHLDHDASRGVHEDYNLKAMCQQCHLRFDAEPNRLRRTGQPRLPLVAEGLPPWCY